MPERGQTIFAADQVGFQKMPKADILVPGVPGDFGGNTYAFIFSDGLRTFVVPINDNIRRTLIDKMRNAPLIVIEDQEHLAKI